MIVGNKNLPALRQVAYAAIDSAAETCRLQYMTPGYGQAMVYLQKLAEAQRFITAYPTAGSPGVPTVADPVDWPFVSAELNINGSSMWAVADTIVTTAQAWLTVAPQVETLRLSAKRAVTAAMTQAAIAAAQSVSWPSPSSSDLSHV